jgi:hypothetical protein
MMDDAEADVFLLMTETLRVDSKLDMAGMWKERIPKLKLRIYQLDRCEQRLYERAVCSSRCCRLFGERSCSFFILSSNGTAEEYFGYLL